MELTLNRVGDVFILDMGDGEQRFNPTSVTALNTAIDRIEAVATGDEPEQIGMVTTATGKFFSNGIDLDWMMNDEPKDVGGFIRDMLQSWARVMALPIPTVAAINGHAFAGGAMFSLAHDRVVMRADRGYWCVNEVLLQLPLAPGMQALLAARLPAATFRTAILTAHRFDGAAAVSAGIADETHPESVVLDRAVELAQSLVHTANPILGRLKEDLHALPLAALREGASPAPM